ncbi:MAG: Si-specific NAD(P)(+) transhydrogenase [Phycisphaerae bacterium]|nr:Si-specific NAD(P)(+) transhydrogenase [Phycisphaerae bacterium]MDW8263136.1 Si-specific NAD(P)(+) transhydrogenase [Phycisphaerales bacterium]
MAETTPKESFDYDLIVIGGGPAGEKGAAQAAYFGHRVMLIEQYKAMGGACINWGTLASKTLRESALFMSGFRTRQLGEGMTVEFKSDISLANFMARKNLVQQRMQEQAHRNMDAPWHNVKRVHGRGRIEDAHTVSVKYPDGGQERFTARFILIATGSVPNRPKHIPFDEDHVFDATTILEMKRVPRSLTVVGGGVIASEYACLFNELGIETHMVHTQPRAMNSQLDTEIADIFMQHMQRRGIRLHMNDSVEEVKIVNGKVRSRLKSGQQLETETMLWAIGRDGNTDGLGLENVGITVNKYKNIEKVDRITYQTTVPNIYAAGDVAGMEALASTSMEQARLAMCHAFNLKYKTRLAPILPAGIYTIPEISMVGKTEQQCRKEGIPYVVGCDTYGRHGRGQIIGDTEGMIKLIFCAIDGKLLGVHVIGEIASELVHVGMACLHFDGDIDFFIHTCFNYPTLSDVYKYAAYVALGKLNKVRAAAAEKAWELSGGRPG